MKTEMKVLLYIKRSGQDKDGFSPLMGRISVRGKGELHRAIRVQVQNRRAVVERHSPTLHGQKQSGDNGKQGD
ncbi:hypothetical protein [Bacteroides thetaiotaomicron]|uniref:hypothetical protein n=1 Tax=Bacteroides thetaiotaomicron TaxID=818 RepID=UPI002165AC1A|nr:hypothetical protein [Bacteroides thetaiotaomicron]MCS2203464.1 hypothetical protein [Bacteroides thetaiotaomicron]